jgi:citrate synthase
MSDSTGAGPVAGDARLTTREAAERLGVKPETVYAYVSRGQLTSRRDPSGRGSTFDPKEVDALVRRARREPSAGSDATQRISTGITLIDTDRYYYRGVDATELARGFRYEEVADWLWTGTLRAGTRLTAPAEPLAAARRAVGALPAHAGTTDQLRVAAIAAAVADPLRFDLSRDAVLGTARALIPTLVDALPVLGGDGAAAQDGIIAARLWPRLTAEPPAEAGLRALDIALSLMIDHDLAASTLAVRVAASVDGQLHGAASGLAHRMLTEVLDRGSAAAVVSDHLRAGRRVPGLGHPLYPRQDPRAEALFEALTAVPGTEAAVAAAREVEATTARHVELHANVDLALAALSVASGMRQDAGETVFAVARTAGWIAHALEEYEERPLRMRPSGHYNGPRPPRALP